MISRTLIIASVVLSTYEAQACSFNLSAFEAFFNTGCLGIVVLHVMVPLTIQVFPLLFNIVMVISPARVQTSLVRNKFLGRYAKTGFFTEIIFCSISFQSQCMVIEPHDEPGEFNSFAF